MEAFTATTRKRLTIEKYSQLERGTFFREMGQTPIPLVFFHAVHSGRSCVARPRLTKPTYIKIYFYRNAFF